MVTNPETLNDVGEISVESNGGKTGLVIASGTGIDLKDTRVHLKGVDSGDARIEVENGANLIVNEIISEAGKTKVQLNGDGTTAILNNITVQNDGNFSLQTLGDAEQTNTFKLNTITVGDNASFKTSIYANSETSIPCSKAFITGDDVTINLGQNAKADFGGVGDGWRHDRFSGQEPDDQSRQHRGIQLRHHGCLQSGL